MTFPGDGGHTVPSVLREPLLRPSRTPSSGVWGEDREPRGHCECLPAPAARPASSVGPACLCPPLNQELLTGQNSMFPCPLDAHGVC